MSATRGRRIVLILALGLGAAGTVGAMTLRTWLQSEHELWRAHIWRLESRLSRIDHEVEVMRIQSAELWTDNRQAQIATDSLLREIRATQQYLIEVDQDLREVRQGR